MENKNIITLRLWPRHRNFSAEYYCKQFCKGEDPSDYLIIDTTSGNRKLRKDLSPFYLGSCLASDGAEARCVENLWQFGKVYAGTAIYHPAKNENIEVACSDSDGNPTEEWFDIRRDGYASTRANRHPFDGEFSYCYFIENGTKQRLSYIEGRKKIYIPAYAQLVAKTNTFKELQEFVDSGKKLALVDYDGYNYYNSVWMAYRFQKDVTKKGVPKPITLEDHLSIRSLKDVVNYPYLHLGHCFVIKALLQNDIAVNEDGTIQDNVGLLK